MDRRSRAPAAAAQADAVCGPPPARRRAHDVSSRSPRLGRWTSRPRGRRATGMSAAFQDLVDLAGERLGAVVVAANDDFFAPKENLIKHGAPVWIEAKYTDRGKWMDGWETRRLREPRAEPYDWCVIRLGAAGLVRGVDVETTHFKGNYPESCAVDVASGARFGDRKSTRLNSSHSQISYAVFCLKKKKNDEHTHVLCNGLVLHT